MKTNFTLILCLMIVSVVFISGCSNKTPVNNYSGNCLILTNVTNVTRMVTEHEDMYGAGCERSSRGGYDCKAYEYEISGNVLNNCDKAASFISVQITVYDQNNEIMKDLGRNSSLYMIYSNIQPGKSESFSETRGLGSTLTISPSSYDVKILNATLEE